jgi:adenine/guanine/hypoxanthine permease
LTSLTVAALFCFALFFWSLSVIIPPQARRWSAMMQGLARIDMTPELVNMVPIVLTLLVTALTNNLVNVMASGTLNTFALEAPWAVAPRFRRSSGGFIGYAVVTPQIF